MCALQTLIRRKPVLYREASVFEACKNLLSRPPAPIKPAASASASVINCFKTSASGISCFKRYDNPCLDLYFNVIPAQPVSAEAHLNRLLPLAWSHDPLITLKIIYNYHYRYYYEGEEYAKAVYWLHHNHPKTLAFNLPYLVAGIGHYSTFTTVLYNVLGCEEDVYPFEGPHVIDQFRTAIHTQPNFRFLHDRVSDLFAQGLEFDIQNLKNRLDNHDDEDAIMEITDASENCDDVPLLLESIAKRVFPDSTSVEEAVERLRKEVLEPLNKVLDHTDRWEMNPWGYRVVDDRTKEPYFLFKKYLKDAKESSVDKMVANALLPNQIVSYVDDEDLRRVVELQWKIMVEDLKKNYKETLSHSLVVIHPDKYLTSTNTDHAVVMSLTILISELSVEDAWKGKFIPLIPKPRLELIQGDDLKSKCQFLREGVDTNESVLGKYTDFKIVFDLILQEAVDRSLKPDQMIKRLYVLTHESHKSFAWISTKYLEGGDDEEMQSTWQVQDYEEMKSKYKEHGYELPHIVFWKIGHHLEHVQHTPDERGIVTMSGYHLFHGPANFVNMFLENDGEMSPKHIMEANLAHQDYDQSLLAVLD